MSHFSIVYHDFDGHVILQDLGIDSFERTINPRVQPFNMIIHAGISVSIHAEQIFFFQLNGMMSKYQVLKSQFFGECAR